MLKRLMLRFWVKEKERLASLSVPSPRATQRASHSLADTEPELEGCGSGAMILAAAADSLMKAHSAGESGRNGDVARRRS